MLRAPELKMAFIMPLVLSVVFISMRLTQTRPILPGPFTVIAATVTAVVAVFTISPMMANAFALDRDGFSAKHAVVGLTRQLAHELGPFNITVNSVAPGFIRSNPDTEVQWDGYGAEGQKALISRIALKRLGSPQDIANGVVFFASELAGFVNGQILSVDGGR